jgi:hypothetical protein
VGEPCEGRRAAARGLRFTRSVPTAAIVAIVVMAVLAAGNPVGSDAPASNPPARGSQWIGLDPGGSGSPAEFAAQGTLAADPTVYQTAARTPQSSETGSQPAGPTFRPIGVLAVGPGPKGAGTDPKRPLPVQSADWLALKASGRIALVDGSITVLADGSYPMTVPSTGLPVPAKKLLDVSWTRWIIEVPGVGRDENGTYYRDLSYWKLCGDGAMTVALWYWQQLTGHPNVTGAAGYFLDPYVAQGAYWPKPGPRVALKGRTRLGTYWSGSDKVSGFTAHARGFEMYLATTAKPATWQSPGFAVFASNGKPTYPSWGTDRSTIQAGLNWEVSDHDPNTWGTAYYTSVIGSDPYFTHDLNAAVMLDVGRDGVPVVAAVDRWFLPNWKIGAATKHLDHSIAIVGYDNTANPPTYTYTETCGHACNSAYANRNGDIHVIPQATLVLAMRYRAGAGFVW